MGKKQTVVSLNLPICLLFVALAYLKLTDHIDISWTWVTAAIWLPWAVAMAALLMMLSAVGLMALASFVSIYVKSRRS